MKILQADELVSIVLAVFNGERYLDEQIESLLLQTYTRLEILILDDGSTDQSEFIARRWAEKDERIRVIRNEKNLGIASNFLKGASLSKGDYICFSDQDDVWRSDKISILKGLLKKDPRNMLAYSDLEVCDENLRKTYTSFWSAAGILPKKGRLRERAFLRNIMPGCSILFRGDVKEVMDKARNEAPFMHDHLAYVIAASLGKIVYTREKLVRYRQHARNNIGAFYPSVHEDDKCIQSIRLKAAYVSHLEGIDPAGLERLGRFCDSVTEKHFWQRIPFMLYYLDSRKDVFKDKALGVLECLMPDAYRWLRATTKETERGCDAGR